MQHATLIVALSAWLIATTASGEEGSTVAPQHPTVAAAAVAKAEEAEEADRLAGSGGPEMRAAARNRRAMPLSPGDAGDPRAASQRHATLADSEETGAAIDRRWLEAVSRLVRRENAQGDGAAARERLARMVDRARNTPLHGAAVFDAADFYFGEGEYRRAAEHLVEGLAVAPELVRGAYGALFVTLADAQERAESVGAFADASALIDARIAILRTFSGAEAADPVQTLLFQKFYLLFQAEEWGSAADALDAWAAAAPIDAEERAFVEEMATLQLTATELSGYSEARDVQLGLAELSVAFAELLDPGDSRRSRALRARAAAESGLGLHNAAAGTLLEAAAVLERSDDRSELHLVYAEMATNAWQRGELELARAFDEQAAAAYRAAIAAGAPPLSQIDRAIQATNRARLALDLGQPRRALRHLQDARAAFENAEASGPLKWNERREAARIEAASGLALTELGEIEEGLAATRRAVEIARETMPQGHPDFALMLGNAADLMFSLSRADEALPLLREAVAINAAALPPTLPQAVDVERKLALHHLARGRLAEASDVLTRVTDARKAPSHRDLLREAAIDFEIFAFAALERGDSATAIEALQWTEVTRSAEALAQMEARFSLEDPAQALLVRRRQDLLEAHRRTTSRLLASFGAADSAAERSRLGEELASLDEELGRVEASLIAAGLDLPGLGAIAPLPLGEIQRLLDDDEALVMFLLPGLDPNRIAGLKGSTNRVFAITSDGVVVAPVAEVSRRRLRARIAEFRCLMAASDTGCGAGAAGTRGAMLEGAAEAVTSFDTHTAHSLWRDLFGGIETAIAPKSHLIVVPPSDLLDLPIAALVTSARPAGNLADVDWLIRRHALSILPSVSALRTLRRRDRSARMVPFLGIGDPEIGRAGGYSCNASTAVATRAAAPATSVVATLPTGLGLADVGAIAALPRLPDAACEVEAIAGLLGEPSRLLLDAAATEGAIKAMNESGELERYRLLVFATHGLVAGEAGAAAPGLVLTPPAEASLLDDGLLTSAEIATLRLDAELVVLSACNTAAGERGDADGLSGLARAFFSAGARSLLVTHWAVFSDAAVMISTGALSRIDEDPALRHAEALRAATLAIIDAPAQTERRRHPSFWAAFTIVGAS